MEDKKILTLLLGSPRIGGNTEKIADALAEGAAEKGYEARKVHLAALTLKGCLDCRKCWSTGKPCIQNDDMDQVYPEIEDASVIAFVSPLYFYSWTSQIKPVWDRLLPYYMPGALVQLLPKKQYSGAPAIRKRCFDGMRASFKLAIIFWDGKC
jgi:multimeric flavodoxin WrbA